MPIYFIESNDKKVKVVMRHRCVACIRKMAIMHYPHEEEMWIYRAHTGHVKDADHNFPIEGRNEILQRLES